MKFVEFCIILQFEYAEVMIFMTLKDKLMPLIKQNNLSFEEFSKMVGMSPQSLNQKIEKECLNVGEAYIISDVLKLESPANIFFYY